MKLILTVAAFLISGFVTAAPLQNIVVFGDSLSDNGNLYEYMHHQLPQSPPYFEGRFSNGPVWIEHLAKHYFPNNPHAHVLNYAFGGAGVSMDEDDDDVLFTLRREINSYLLVHGDKANEDTLYILWIGSNNYLAMPNAVEQTLKEVNDGIEQALKKLVDKGAKHILVLNLPDLGKTPAAIDFGSVEGMRYFSDQHNAALAQTVVKFKETNPEVEWFYMNMNQMFDQVVEHPEDYGFTNITGSCVNLISDKLRPKSLLKMVASVKPNDNSSACDGYLFFDLVHPTGYAHQILSEKIRMWLEDAGIQFTEN